LQTPLQHPCVDIASEVHVPSVASEVSASQQSRVQQSNVRNRADSSDRSQNSPFSEMLDSTAPAAEPPPTSGNARAEKSDATRPADKNGKTDAPADRTPSISTKDASVVADAANALGDLGGRITVDGLGVFGGSGKGGNDATAAAGSEDGTTTAATDADAAANPDADVATALPAMVVDQKQPVVAANVIAAPPPATADVPALSAATNRCVDRRASG
jgi:hypothetical protein